MRSMTANCSRLVDQVLSLQPYFGGCVPSYSSSCQRFMIPVTWSHLKETAVSPVHVSLCGQPFTSPICKGVSSCGQPSTSPSYKGATSSNEASKETHYKVEQHAGAKYVNVSPVNRNVYLKDCFTGSCKQRLNSSRTRQTDRYAESYEIRKCKLVQTTGRSWKDLSICVGVVKGCSSLFVQSRAFHSSCLHLDNKDWNKSPPVKRKPPWKVLFFGTDTISVDTLKALYENMNICSPACVVESLDVITVHGKPPVRQFAESVDLPTVQWPIRNLRHDYDVGVLVSFGHMIPQWLINKFPYGIVNMHPSLLPKWRGASPIIHTVLNGDTVTGVSIIQIRPRHFDTGPILLQQSMRVPGRITSFQLAYILGKIGASLVVECLKDLPTFERYEHEQDNHGISYAHKILPVNANIDWCNQTVYDIDCHYRAISELKPLRSQLNGHPVKLKEMVDPHLLKVVNTKNIAGYHDNVKLDRPGMVTYHKHLKCLLVTCKDGFVGFRKIVMRKELSAQAFYNGYMNQTGWTFLTSLSNDLNRYVEAEKVPVSAA